jgi:hypothetical protein
LVFYLGLFRVLPF